MKKVLKLLFKLFLIALIVVVLIVATVFILYRDTVAIITGTAGIDGLTGSVPSAQVASAQLATQGKADWPRWRGVNNDGRSGVTGILTDWSAGLTQLWEVNFLCQGKTAATWSAPVISGDRLIVCGRNEQEDTIFCLNATSGKLLWKASYEAPARTNHGSGARATPCIDGSRVYTFGRSGDLACWDILNKGKQLWRKNVKDEGGSEPEWGFASSPLVLGNLVIVQAGGTARTIAYDKNNGDVVWKTGQGNAGYAAVTTIKLDGREIILAMHATGLAAIEPDGGKLLWDTPWQTSYEVNATTPIIHDNLIFITSGYSTGGTLLEVDSQNVKPRWRNKAITSQHSDPHIINGYIYGYSGQSYQNRGAFKCIDLKTGSEQWTTNEMGWGTSILIDGYLLCIDTRGNLFLMQPNPKAFTQVTSMPNALGDIKGPVWTTPAAANGRLYLRFKQKLVCLDLMKR